MKRSDQILECLIEGNCTASDISAITGIGQTVVGTYVNRLAKEGHVKVVGEVPYGKNRFAPLYQITASGAEQLGKADRWGHEDKEDS